MRSYRRPSVRPVALGRKEWAAVVFAMDERERVLKELGMTDEAFKLSRLRDEIVKQVTI